MKPTSDGLRDLLTRNGIKPTGISALDIELARKIMPKSWSETCEKEKRRNTINKTKAS